MRNQHEAEDFAADEFIRSVICAYDCQQPDMAKDAWSGVDEGDFRPGLHRDIARAIDELHEAREEADTSSVIMTLKLDGKAAAANHLSEAMPATWTNVKVWKRRFMALSGRRRLTEAVNGVDEGVGIGEMLKSVQGAISSLSGNLAPSKAVTAKKAMKEVFVELQGRWEGTLPAGLKVGFGSVDNLLGGLYPGGLTVIAARPGVGKTAISLAIARNIYIAQSKRVAYISCEMTRSELLQRLCSMESRVPLSAIRTGEGMDKTSISMVADAMGRIASDDLVIYDGAGPTLATIESIARKADIKGGVLMVDYLQLCRSGGKHERNDLEIGAISQGLKGLAKELECHVICLSQLNRGSEQLADKKPSLAHLRGSGSIEQDADVVILMHHKDENDKSEVAVRVAKNRHGQVGLSLLNWHGATVSFREQSSVGVW